MKFGSHVSIAGGLPNAPLNAAEIGCECFQFFSRSPRGGKAPEITPQIVKEFKENCRQAGIVDYFIHTPYYINLASSNKRIYHGSISVIKEELARGSKLGAKYAITHLGSGKDVGRARATEMVIKGLKEVFAGGKKYKTELLLENTAGLGMIIGDTFEELGKILRGLGKKDVGVCFDTAHAYASGYDILKPKGLESVLNEFDKNIGLKQLKLVHGNDSKVGLGERKDRHEKIGQGELGYSFFRHFVNNPKINHLNLVLETPKDTPEDDITALKYLKKVRGNE